MNVEVTGQARIGSAYLGEIMSATEGNPWELAQAHLRTILDDHSYKNWVERTRFASYTEGRLVVQVPNSFYGKWLHDHYMDAISAAIRKSAPEFRELVFEIAPKKRDPAAAKDKTLKPEPAYLNGNGKNTAQFANIFNSLYTFGRFVVGSGNRFAHAASKAVAESPGAAYNPLFVYGTTGLGKTHLMQAIGQEINDSNPHMRVVYISAENFANELIVAIATKSTPAFRRKYRKVDVLLIDDIQFIRRKESTQEEFFHTFNELFDTHKQIVLSSDCGPKDIEGLETRLVSRFEWGLVTDIQPPEMETRVAILQNKAREKGAEVPIDVLNYIAARVTTNVRHLEGSLVRMLAYAKLTNNSITLKMAEDVLRDLIGKDEVKPVTIEAVQQAVAKHFDLRLADLRSHSRKRQVAHPRHVAMYLCRKLVPSASSPELAEAFGGRHHTTVLYACKEIAAHVQSDTALKQLITQLEKDILSQ